MQQKDKKVLLIFAAIAMVLIIIMAIMGGMKKGDSNEQKVSNPIPEKSITQPDEPKFDPVQDSISFNDKILSTISSLKETDLKSGKRFSGTWDEMAERLSKIQIEFLDDSARIIDKFNSKYSQKLIREYRSVLISSMKNNYRQVRLIYVQEKNEAMFAQNMEVDLSGNDGLIITGAILANNQNKLSFKKGLEEINLFDKLRFKSLKLRWFKYDDGTTWLYSTPKDDQIRAY